MFFQIDYTNVIFIPMARLGAVFLLLLGIIWIVYGVFEGKRRKSFTKRKTEDWDFKITSSLKILTALGFIVGILAVMSGVAELILNEPPSLAYGNTVGESRNIFTAVLLILIGLFAFLKPLNDLPISSIIGIAAATLVVILVSLMIPQYAVDFIGEFIDPRLFLVILFIVIFAIAALVVKFYIGGLMTLSKLVSWPPLAIILAVLCFIQSFLLLAVGVSLI